MFIAPSVVVCPPGYIAKDGPDNGTVCESPNSTNWLGAVALREGADLDRDWREYGERNR